MPWWLREGHYLLFPVAAATPRAEFHWQLQLRAAEDSRMLALYGCCDVFLSLHRSEGFGRCMAEALQLGVGVIATAYGGNTDFCTGPLSTPAPMATCGGSRIWSMPLS